MSSARINALSRSSPRLLRFHSMTLAMCSRRFSPATTAAMSSSGPIVKSRIFTRAWDHSRNCALSPSGIPNISEMTANGSGKARSAIRSISPRSATASRCSSTMRSIIGARSATRRGVNTLLTSLRKRVWSGGSMLRIEVSSRGALSGNNSARIFARSRGSSPKISIALRTSTLSVTSRRSCTDSAWLNTIHGPNGVCWIGSLSRSTRYSS